MAAASSSGPFPAARPVSGRSKGRRAAGVHLSLRLRCGVCGVLLLVGAAAAAQPPRDLVRRFTEEQWERFRPLFTLVHDASAGQPVPSDETVTWRHDVLKAEANMDFVPFTLGLPPGTFRSFPLALYVRVVQHGAVANVPGPHDALAQYPFEDVALFDKPIDGRISRAFAAPAGRWDVYVALGEAANSDSDVPRMIVLKREIDLPDLSAGLALSSVIVADRVDVDRDLTRPDFEAQLDDPYRLWGLRITPALDRRFGRGRTLSLTFLVYNTAATAEGKPDVQIDYAFFLKHEATESLFGRAESQVFSADTLPPDFSLPAGDLIIAGEDVPLKEFPDGDFRLQLTVADRIGRITLIRDLEFTVAGR